MTKTPSNIETEATYGRRDAERVAQQVASYRKTLIEEAVMRHTHGSNLSQEERQAYADAIGFEGTL